MDPTLSKLLAGSTQRVAWRCERGHEWTAVVRDRVRDSTGCPFCSGNRVLVGFNDLRTTQPALAAELVDPQLGMDLSAGSSNKVEWQCELGHRWESTVANRVTGNSGCPVCSGRAVLIGFNDLATTHPELLSSLVDERLATQISAGSHRKVAWQCALGHVWESRVAQRIGLTSGCPFCSGRKAWPGFNDLATTHPQLVAELVDSSVRHEVTFGSKRRVRWQCELGHEWVATFNSRSSGEGCPFCGGRRALAGFNDLATTHPDLASELVDRSDALTVSAGSRAKLRWRCPLGHEWVATVNNRTSMSTGCPDCALPGFSPTSPGCLYLLRSESWRAWKFGISNVLEQRVLKHSKSGFPDLVEVVEFQLGADAYAAEKRVKAHAAEHGWLPALTRAQMRDGWSETLRVDDTGPEYRLSPIVGPHDQP